MADPSRPPLPQVARMYRKNNDCASCHAVNQGKVGSGPGHMGLTDSAGFYEILAVLFRQVAIKADRPWDLNVGDPFMEISCFKGKARIRSAPGARAYVCPDGKRPLAMKKMEEALAAKDPHALKVCESRKYLFDRMEPDARQAFRMPFEVCGIY
jgi:hypothetical protein